MSYHCDKYCVTVGSVGSSVGEFLGVFKSWGTFVANALKPTKPYVATNNGTLIFMQFAG